ncbi:CHAT domain-containing protein [Flammula alnicola]|nr:CHAT domain-containing protein [Flammula alnicola]
MATSEYTDEVEIAASVAHSQGQPALESATENAAQQGAPIPVLETSDTTTSSSSVNVSFPKNMPSVVQGTEGTVMTSEHNSTPATPLESSAVSISEVDLPYELPRHSNVSISEDTASHQPTPPEITEEPQGIATTISSAVFTGTSEQSSPKGLLKDIFLEYSSPHHFNDALTLAVMRSGNFETLRLTKISPTKWKAVETIDFHHDGDGMMLIVHSKDGGDEAFLAFTADEIYTMACAEEDTPAEHVFASVKEDNPMSVKMTSTVASSSTFGSGAMDDARGLDALLPLGAMSDWRCAISSAQAFERRFEETGNIDDITQVISHYESAVSSVPPGLDILPTISNILGNSYLSRFKRTGDLEDNDRAISYHQSAVESTPSSHVDLPSCFNNLGCSYLLRFQRTGDLEDNDRAISYHQSAVESTPSGHADLPTCFNNLGTSYMCRFEHTGDLQDIDRAISHRQSAVESTPSSHANLPGRFDNLGTSYMRRFGHTGDLQDIEHAISHHQSALESTPSSHADLPGRFNNLGTSYAHRFECTGDLQDIDHAISHHQSAVKSTPSGHADLPGQFSNLGTSYMRRFERTGDLQDIDHAISHHESAVKSTPSGHANLPARGWFTNLGSSYLLRFQRTSDLQDIDRAISYHQSAVESTPSGHADLPTCFNNLGTSYMCRFEHTGDLQDIERAISHNQSAVESTPSGHAGLPGRFNNLGTSYICRFEHTGDFQDIDRAISHHQSAVESTPSGHANLPRRFNNLGNSYARRFECTGDLQDIDRAISHYQSTIKSIPSGHANLPRLFSNLGASYMRRFECTGDLQDIDRAISHNQSAVESTPSGHAGLPPCFNNLGTSYAHRFERTGDLQDIDRAISHYQSALRFQGTHNFSDVQNSIASYRRGAEANGTPSVRLKSAKRAAMLSSVHDDSRCLIDFALAISLLSEVAGMEQTIHRRHANLHGHSDLVGSAVATALHCNKADLALEWLEQGRCLVWNQLNQLRTPIDNLRVRNPSLADRFIKVASALESYGTRSAPSIPSSHATLSEDVRLQDDTRNHTLRATEYRQLLKEIRDLPDFHDFLQLPKAADLLSSLPSDGPVIIFNIHNTRCDALVVIPGIALHIPLENFSLVQAEQLQKTLQSDLLDHRDVEDGDRAVRRYFRNPPSMSFVLKELWSKVVQPILEVLGYSYHSDPSDRRRIWWCPTGPLAFLPLHAAGIYGSEYQPGSCVSDFVVSSYTPTVRSLNDKFLASSTSSRSTSLVLISQPHTPGLRSIPSTRTETHALEALMKGTAVDALLLEDSEATREKVKAEIKSRSWVHFACHGVQDVHQPLESGLCLHDGRLELLEIMKQQIPNPDLAFLSACQTSKGDLKLSEEVVHLAAGMLAAGYRGVVGTMWSISDMHGPEFAKEFYQYLLKENGSEGLDSTWAAYALDYATRKVRESLGEGDTSFMTWVPYVHFGY